MFASNIDKETLNTLPRIRFTGQIIVAESEADLAHWLPVLCQEQVIGFDTESKPSFKKGKVNGISLLQLANSKLAILVKLKKTGIPVTLKDFLENPEIVKVGVAIHDDLKGLQKLHRFTPNGFIDLQRIAPTYGIEELSVKKLSAVVLGATVSKGQQLSNWEADVLTEAQTIYASTDAWVCSEIYLKLISHTPKQEH
ncbi:MAG TPA: 3'-5' exonuclease domain-containing protein 2 [Bacteroidales bacterium]|nr:3'-5' exonuclease domain-containing protein 2 [Bacteroidales bacterium]